MSAAWWRAPGPVLRRAVLPVGVHLVMLGGVGRDAEYIARARLPRARRADACASKLRASADRRCSPQVVYLSQRRRCPSTSGAAMSGSVGAGGPIPATGEEPAEAA